MANSAEKFVSNALATASNSPGYCLQVVRTWAGIAAKYPDATTAWKHTRDRHPGDRKPPRGSAVYWTGGSHGYGHIACSLGNGQVRSTDCTYSGKTGTCDLGWVEKSWGLPYAGWAWDINDVTIPHDSSAGSGGDDDMNQGDTIGKWSPDDGPTGDTTIGKTLNQARGYAEDAYQRVKQLETTVASMQKTLDQIWQKVK